MFLTNKKVRRAVWKVFYELLAKLIDGQNIDFMNYGYSKAGDQKLELKSSDEGNRYCIQLYQHLVSQVDVSGKRVLEVGSGRGGGVNFISGYHNPTQVVGLDRSSVAVNKANKKFKSESVSYVQGDAEDLGLETSNFDVVLNVESSHCYGSVPKFFREVNRVLVPSGLFLFADMRDPKKVETLEGQFKRAGFKIINQAEITPQVINSMNNEDERKRKIITDKAPKIMHAILKEFAAVKGSSIHKQFVDNKLNYYSYILEKETSL